MSCDTHRSDVRRFGMIEVRQDYPGLYRLTINGTLWASVEWSGSKCCWCIEDACNRCLEHVEHIFGEDANPDRAIKAARRMIRDGRMPTPEEALEALERLEEQKAQEREVVEEDIRRVTVPLSGLEAREPELLPIEVDSSDEDAP